jgi:TPP-dependent 2-oxoacid decarboxylase
MDCGSAATGQTRAAGGGNPAGRSVGAAFGYGMGLQPDRRLVAVIGDGSFQLTAQEVANMIRYGQETLSFPSNNRRVRGRVRNS